MINYLKEPTLTVGLREEANTKARADLAMSCVLSGYRSVPLKNSYSEELELASLLVHIEIVNAKVSLFFFLLLIARQRGLTAIPCHYSYFHIRTNFVSF